MTDLRKAAEMALEDICGAKLCEVNSMSSRAEMLRLMDKAAEALRQALAIERFSEVNQEIEEALKQPEQEAIKQAYLDGVNSGIEAEREACARMCDLYGMPDGTSVAALTLAKAIRARSEK